MGEGGLKSVKKVSRIIWIATNRITASKVGWWNLITTFLVDVQVCLVPITFWLFKKNLEINFVLVNLLKEIFATSLKDKRARIIQGARMFCNETDKSLITFTEYPNIFQSWLHLLGDESARTFGVYLIDSSTLRGCGLMNSLVEVTLTFNWSLKATI